METGSGECATCDGKERMRREEVRRRRGKRSVGRRVGTVEGAQHRIDHKLGVRTITNNMKGGFTNQNTINTPADIAMHVRWIRGRYELWAYSS